MLAKIGNEVRCVFYDSIAYRGGRKLSLSDQFVLYIVPNMATTYCFLINFYMDLAKVFIFHIPYLQIFII